MTTTGRSLRRVAAIGALVLVSACANPWSEYAPTLDEVFLSGWLMGDGPVPPAEPVYCYRTLAEPDCHARPLADEASRLQGYLGPPPVPNDR